LLKPPSKKPKGKTQLKSATETGKQGPKPPHMLIKHSQGFLATTTSDQEQCPSSKRKDNKVTYPSLHMNKWGNNTGNSSHTLLPISPPFKTSLKQNAAPQPRLKGRYNNQTSNVRYPKVPYTYIYPYVYICPNKPLHGFTRTELAATIQTIQN
jgi:hypothetical protein